MLTERTILRVAFVVAAIAAMACIWKAWCEFPMYSWNEVRVAPAFALRYGINPYPPLGGGPLSTWIYGPVGILINLPATFAPSAKDALEAAGLINAIIVISPLAIVFLTSRELRARSGIACWLAIAAGVLFTPISTLTFQVADGSAIAFGILSCWCLARSSSVSTSEAAAGAALCTLAIWAKQSEVFLIAAHVLFLDGSAGRRTTFQYLAFLALWSGLALAVGASVFGFSNLWLNTVIIPTRIPWADDIPVRLSMHGATLMAQIALPALAIIALRRARRWPGRDAESGRFFRCAVLAFAAMIPIGIASLLKFGGNRNVLHAWAYLLPAALLAWLIHDRFMPARGYRVFGVIVIGVVLHGSDFISMPQHPQTDAYTHAAQLTTTFPRASWFPNNPLITFYADHNLWHTQDGIVTRDLAGIGLRKSDFRRHIPTELRMVIYPAGVIFPAALQLLPEFRYRKAESYWEIYSSMPFAQNSP
jgi:hypothetical protein